MPDRGEEPAIHSKLAISGHENISVRPVEDAEIGLGMALAAQHLEQALAAEDTLRGIRACNADSLWGIFKAELDGQTRMIGFCAFLILNPRGASALLDRRLDLHAIDLGMIAAGPDSAEVLYVWGILARGISSTIVGLINEVMVKKYRGRPLYATAATDAGLKFMRKSGYVPIVAECSGLGALHRRVGPRVDLPLEPKAKRHVLKVVPVATADEFEKAMAIRHVFLSEQNCPFEEEFDGNDRTGTVFLGFVDGEPAATVRVRYFAGFFKLERLAVLPRFRRTRIAWEIVQVAVDFCRRKGYTRGFGHAQKRFEKFWNKFGFKRTERNLTLNFSDHEYIEMYGDLDPHERALTMESDPYLMIRPEGRWDEPGILERSANRPVMGAS